MKKFIFISIATLFSVAAFSQTRPDSLYLNFQNPPDYAKPRVWWHWMNGNITKDGIRKDLEWMRRIGIGGFQNFDAALETPQIVDKRLTYMTPEWKDAFRFAIRLADSLHLESAIAGSPGWSESGGPWVKPEDGMKKIEWTETRVKGGTSGIKLPVPSGTTGRFQNLPMQSDHSANAPSFYKDVAVIAYKLPGADKSLSELGVTVTSSGGRFSLEQLTDGDLATSVLLPKDSVQGFAWIQFAFPQPQVIKAITMVGGGNIGFFGFGADPKDSRKLEASDDGVNFKFVSIIPPGAILQQTIAVPATTAKYFRVTVQNRPEAKGDALFGFSDDRNPNGTPIAEINLHTTDVINCFEEKAAFAPVGDLNKNVTAASNDVVATTDIVDLTSKMNSNGVLNWTVPAGGEWKIVRFGYSLLGVNNHPASPEATGLEVDKLDPVAVKNYFENYLDQYKSATGGLMGNKGLQYIVTDSWEAGAQNWTANLPAEFQNRRGYSIISWLPVLTGTIVKSSEASEAFLFDFRKTLSEMVAEYHYDALTKILAERGMKRYSESHEDGRAFIADGMEVKRTAAIPMSALWTSNPFNNKSNQAKQSADIRESASVAHIYGQNLVAAESLTAYGIGGIAWAFCPENLKPSVDLEMASGLNRFVIHCSVHQPVDDKIPGLGLGPFGQWFTRHETWAEQAGVWTKYLARSSYLLQQGKFAADIVYYYGEDNNITNLFGKNPPAIPEGYNFDYINSNALINVLSVKDGKLVTPSGMSYRLLVLDSSAVNMSLPVLRKLNELIKAGASVAGMKPERAPGLNDDSAEYKNLLNAISSPNNEKVHFNQPLDEVLKKLGITPDFTYAKPDAETKLFYVHRKLSDGDLYWVNNRNDRAEDIEAAFRVEGKLPVIWHPETGKTEAASYTIENGVTKVNLHLQPADALFVMFREKATKSSITTPRAEEKELTTIAGSWKVNFQKQRGAPASSTFDKLVSYTENEDAGIKYFSGTASYTKIISAEKSWFAGNKRLWLDLGEVKNLAEVIVNEKSLGIVWKKPFRVDITNALKVGANKIEIKVTNLWVNRLIGDEQPNVEKKITYTTMPFYDAKSKLLPSGLLGPVKVVEVNGR